MTASDKDFETFVGICREAVAQQVSGRTGAFQALWFRDDDVVLIGAAGSPQKGWHDDDHATRWACHESCARQAGRSSPVNWWL